MNKSGGHQPAHVAVIMDGNGRWARQKGLPRIEGHRRGIEAAREIVRAAADTRLRYLTLFAFSAENWRRPPDEVSALMDLLHHFLRKERAHLLEKKIRLHCIGRIDELPQQVAEQIRETVAATAQFTERNLVVALNYGSRTEIADAVRAYVLDSLSKGEAPENCTWEHLSRHLYTSNIPDPDLIIRTSGESRLSNFLLLQAAYSEIYISPVLWPEFGRDEFFEALESFRNRERRFGRTGEQLQSPLSEAVNPL